jgi:GTP-binding protein HflX
VQLPGGRVILFTDTVGFISKLPHDLVAAFHATLEEITRADAILHLIDISHPDHQKQARTVMKVLKELNATHIPLITAYNKADMLSSEKQRMLSCHNFLLLSALRGNGTEELLRRIEQIVTPQLHSHRFTLPFSLNQHVGKIYDLSVVKKQEYTPLGTHFVINCTDQSWKLISRLINKDP